MDTTQLQNVMETYQTKIHNLLHGRGGSGGLLAKVPELQYEKATVPVVMDDGKVKNVQKNIYSVHGFDYFGSYSEVVSLSKNGDAPTSAVAVDEIKELMNEFKGSTRYYNTDRGFSMIRAKLEDKNIDEMVIDSAIDSYKKEVGL